MQKISFCERYLLTTAVLNRTKELTRRLEKALQRAVEEYEQLFGMSFSVSSQIWDAKKKCLSIWTPKSHIELKTRYKLGEVVAVAQAYKDIEEYNPESYDDVMLDNGVICEASHPYSHLMKTGGWHNKMFVRPDLMPHQIQITGVRIERLQDISEEDCLKEGVTYDSRHWVNGYKVAGLWNKYLRQSHWRSPREAFAALINRPGVGRKGLWESNPWTVVYQFKLVK